MYASQNPGQPIYDPNQQAMAQQAQAQAQAQQQAQIQAQQAQAQQAYAQQQAMAQQQAQAQAQAQQAYAQQQAQVQPQQPAAAPAQATVNQYAVPQGPGPVQQLTTRLAGFNVSKTKSNRSVFAIPKRTPQEVAQNMDRFKVIAEKEKTYDIKGTKVTIRPYTFKWLEHPNEPLTAAKKLDLVLPAGITASGINVHTREKNNPKENESKTYETYSLALYFDLTKDDHMEFFMTVMGLFEYWIYNDLPNRQQELGLRMFDPAAWKSDRTIHWPFMVKTNQNNEIEPNPVMFVDLKHYVDPNTGEVSQTYISTPDPTNPAAARQLPWHLISFASETKKAFKTRLTINSGHIRFDGFKQSRQGLKWQITLPKMMLSDYETLEYRNTDNDAEAQELMNQNPELRQKWEQIYNNINAESKPAMTAAPVSLPTINTPAVPATNGVDPVNNAYSMNPVPVESPIEDIPRMGEPMTLPAIDTPAVSQPAQIQAPAVQFSQPPQIQSHAQIQAPAVQFSQPPQIQSHAQIQSQPQTFAPPAQQQFASQNLASPPPPAGITMPNMGLNFEQLTAN